MPAIRNAMTTITPQPTRLARVAFVDFNNCIGGVETSLHDASTDSPVSSSRVVAGSLPAGLQPRECHEIRHGDHVTSKTLYFHEGLVAGVELKTRLGCRFFWGFTTNDHVPEDVEEGKEVYGFSVSFKRRAIRDISFRVRKSPSLDELHRRHAAMREASANSGVKNDALLATIKRTVKRTAATHKRGGVAASPVIAALIRDCKAAKKLFRPCHRSLWMHRTDRADGLNRVSERVDKLVLELDKYAVTEADHLLSQGGAVDHAQLRSFLMQPSILVSTTRQFVALHELHAGLFFEVSATDRLLAHLIHQDDTESLDHVARTHAVASRKPFLVAMADFALRYPAVRKAVASGSIRSLCWLLGVARLEPLTPPHLPSPKELQRLPQLPMDMVAAMDSSPVTAAMFSIFLKLSRRRGFITQWTTLMKRIDTPATEEELVALVQTISRVDELQQLHQLMPSSSPLELRQRVFTAAANLIIDRQLVVQGGALQLFLRHLSDARTANVIAQEQYDDWVFRARVTPVIKELQDALQSLNMQVASLETHTLALQDELCSLHQWVVAFQRESLDAAQKERLLSIVSTVFSAFGGGVFTAIGEYLHANNVTQVLSTVVGLGAEGLFSMGVDVALDDGVEMEGEADGDDALLLAAVSRLRAAIQTPAPVVPEVVLAEEEEEEDEEEEETEEAEEAEEEEDAAPVRRGLVRDAAMRQLVPVAV